MNIKELTNEELIERAKQIFGECRNWEYNEVKDELLRRLEEGEKAKRSLFCLINFIPDGWQMPVGFSQL